jgi:hypothetical protein
MPDTPRDPDAVPAPVSKPEPASRYVKSVQPIMSDGQTGGDELARPDEPNPEGTLDLPTPIDRETGA